jgi:poly-gamma-glutamate capsule biosynthesis protein CapA/YwtB (metallophosphatase superfamily)
MAEMARRGPMVAVALLLLASCTSSPSPSVTPPTPTATSEPTPSPSPTPEPEVEVPLAVVTGFTNLRSTITRVEVDALAEADTIVQACELFPAIDPPPRCEPAEAIIGYIQEHQAEIGLVPAGLVQPTVRVLPVDGADLFGGPAVRAEAYPLTRRVQGPPAEWLHDPDEIRTLISLGDSCPDRGVAHAAITLGRGWDWVFGGGTASYTAVYPNPAPPGHVGNGFNIVDAVPSGNAGAVADLVSGADVTLDDFECPVVDDFTVNEGVVFSIDPAVLPRLRDTYGVDAATLAANHLFDRGAAGFAETLDQFAAAGIPTTGAGPDLDAALEPATVEVEGLSFGFVGFNEVVGSPAAAAGQPGVAWLTDENVVEAVARARLAADVVICVPQWWGGSEYHAEFRGAMRDQQATFFEAGCDHVLGHGTHWSGPIELSTDSDGASHVTLVSHGNFLFGQGWSQQTQEGVIAELAFRGTELAQVRLHPYVMLEQAQTNLTDPKTDGAYVLTRIYEASSGLIP